MTSSLTKSEKYKIPDNDEAYFTISENEKRYSAV